MDEKRSFALLIGERIAKARNMRGLSQPDLAEKIGIGRDRWNNISNWERGHHPPPSFHVWKLCKALSCSADYLMGFADEDAIPSNEALWDSENFNKLSDDQISAVRQIVALLNSAESDG